MLEQDFVKQLLVDRLFIGTFQEKRFVDALQAYRDVIVISEEETDIIRDIEIARKKIQEYYKDKKQWIGISTPDMIGTPTGYCLWVNLTEEVFGSYWYKISRIKFSENEVLIRLKIIRPIKNTMQYKKIEKCEHSSENNDSNSALVNVNEVLTNIQLGIKKCITVHNTAEAVKLILLLVIGLGAGLVKGVEFLGNFTIKLMHEISMFMKSITPIVIAFTNLIAKIIGGFYLLILSMWRDRNGPRVYASPYSNHIPYNQNNTPYYKRGLPAPKRSGPTKTPFD